jgi:hypothetical protein
MGVSAWFFLSQQGLLLAWGAMRLERSDQSRFPGGALAGLALSLLLASANGLAAVAPGIAPEVEIEEDVYSFEPADNGAGPLWCSGSTCLVRIGDDVFASGIEKIAGCPPLDNCRWLLFKRTSDGWKLQQSDQSDRTREPSPLAGFPDGRLFLSVNPTLRTNREAGGGPAEPRILQFPAGSPGDRFETILPRWKGVPKFSEHSYRSFAADGPGGELILFQNVGYTHAEWAFRDGTGQWTAQGQLQWPWGGEYDKPQPVRICYPNVAIVNRAVHFCGVSDIVEPYEKWRQFKKELTGRDWDYDFRRLFYTWTADITTGKFHDWVEVASRDKTSGWISPGDLWIAPDGTAHVLWTERALDERLRERFFPEARQSHALNYAVLRKGKVILRRTLAEAREGESMEIPSAGRFQAAPGNRLFVFYYVQGIDAGGRAVSENRVIELRDEGEASAPARVPLALPFTSYFTATVRAGSPPSNRIELLGHRAGKPLVVSYARIRLW